MTRPRVPADLKPPRMEALARLPVFLSLYRKRAVIAGGNAHAARKAGHCPLAAGCAVEVFAPAPGEEMAALAANPPRGPVAIRPRRWSASDFADAAIAVGAFDQDSDAAEFAAAARAAGVAVNVIDKPAFCDFAFGAIVNRSPLVIGISTDGAAPVFGMAVRAKIEAMIPRGFARWADAARRWRHAVFSAGLSLASRRQFWQTFARYAAAHPDREPTQSDFDGFLAATLAERTNADNGAVTLVGAGPGDPELLTLRAVRALQSADIILVDDLVAPAGPRLPPAAKPKKCWSARPATAPPASRRRSTP